jgi:3-dehydroquinate synthase
MKCISVDTPSRTYDVRIDAGLLGKAGKAIAGVRPGGTVLVVTDQNVEALYAGALQQSLRDAGFRTEKFVFPAGERAKAPETLFSLLNAMAAFGMTRTDTVAALGGGVTGDLAGLAAALYMRGIGLVQLPTTLLAAVDSSVGGKTAVDLPAGKNLVGAFYQPHLVLCDTDTMKTLPAAERSNGAAEIIKYAFLREESLLALLTQPERLAELIARCVAVKRDIVRADERDTGCRQLLNFGHTVGHAVEQCSGFTVPHGSAVAVGMAVMTRACVRRGLCAPDCLTRLYEALAQCSLPASTSFSADALFSAMLRDKKRENETVTLVICRAVGRCELLRVPVAEAREFLAEGLGEPSWTL